MESHVFLGHSVVIKLSLTVLLPARRYANAGLCESNVSVRPTVCQVPVLCLVAPRF